MTVLIVIGVVAAFAASNWLSYWYGWRRATRFGRYLRRGDIVTIGSGANAEVVRVKAVRPERVRRG